VQYDWVTDSGAYRELLVEAVKKEFDGRKGGGDVGVTSA
jgi:hypothetical protein